MVLNLRGICIDFSQPKVMGILNLTHDSFYDESRVNTKQLLKERADRMVEAGVDILDVGGMSSRPGAEVIPLEEELNRLRWGLDLLCASYPGIPISVDTLRAEVVAALFEYPIHLINDISGGSYSVNMWDVCAKNNLGYVLMHMKGLPENMQENARYSDASVEVLAYLRDRAEAARQRGLTNLIVDPGFGFGKTISHNFQLLRQLSVFQMLDCPVMVGISRKSMIYKTLDTGPEYGLNGTTALHMIALQNGANVLRVHDVREAKEAVRLFAAYRAES